MKHLRSLTLALAILATSVTPAFADTQYCGKGTTNATARQTIRSGREDQPPPLSG